MVKDIKVNSGWDVQLDDRNDMPLCEGKDAFEQHISTLAVWSVGFLISNARSRSSSNTAK